MAASTTTGGGGTSVRVGNVCGARAAMVAFGGLSFLAQADCARVGQAGSHESPGSKKWTEPDPKWTRWGGGRPKWTVSVG